MSKVVDEFKKKQNLYYEEGANKKQIENAEEILGLKFADDYKEYLMQFGSVSCAGHELTGFSADRNLDVVSVTIENLKRNDKVKKSFYVIEETHLDGIVIWQNESGEIYQAEYKEKPQKIYSSLAEYVSSF